MDITKLLCLGDSLTQAYGVEESKCWVSLLSISTDFPCINAGISGDTTTGMLSRLENLIKSHNPSHLIITGGTNDISFNVPINFILSNIHTITRHCKYHDIIPIIGIPLSIYNEGFELDENQCITNPTFVEHMNNYQNELREFASINDFNFIDFGLYTNKDHLMIDGVHPNEKGHQKMMEIVYKKLINL
jgi:lysophospholipase L1-like esterase